MSFNSLRHLIQSVAAFKYHQSNFLFIITVRYYTESYKSVNSKEETSQSQQVKGNRAFWKKLFSI